MWIDFVARRESLSVGDVVTELQAKGPYGSVAAELQAVVNAKEATSTPSSDVESSLAVLDRVLSEFDDIETDSFFSGDGESPAAAADHLADLEPDQLPPPPPPPVDRSTKPRSSSVAGTPAASWRSSRSGGGDTARSSVGGRRERGSDSPSPSPPGRRASSRVNGLVRSFESSSRESSPPQTVVVSRAQSSVAKPRPGESRPRRSQSETRFGDSVAARRSPPKALRPVGPPPTTRPPPPPPPPGHEPSPPAEQLPPAPPPPPPVVSQPQPTVVSIGNPERSGRSRQRAPSAAAAPPPPPVLPDLPPLPTKAALRQKSSPHLTYYPPGDPRRRSLPAREALSGAAPEVSGNIESKIKRLSLNFEPHGPVVLPVRGGPAREELSRAVLAANGRPDHRLQYHALGSREDRSLDYRHTSAQDLRRDTRDAHALEQVELQQLDYRSHILPERRPDDRLPSVPDPGNHRHASEATYHTVEARTDDTQTRRDQQSDRQSGVSHTRHGVVPSPPEEKERTPSPVETIRSAGAAARTAQRAAQETAAPGGSLPLRRPSGTLADERARAGPRPVRGSPPAAPTSAPAASAAAAADVEEETSPASEEQKPSLPAKQHSARNRDERRPPARRKRDRKRKTDEPPPPPEEAQKQISSLLLTRGPGAGDTPTSTLNGSTMRSAASSAATETGTARSTGPRPLRQASVESRLRPSRPAPSPPIHRQASAPSGSLSSRHSDASATTGTRGSQSFRAMPTGSDERRGRGLRRSDEPPPSRAAAEERVLERDEDGATVGEVTFDLDGSGRTFNYVSYRDGSDGSTPTGPMSLPGSLALDQPDSPPTNSYPKKMPLFSPIVKDRLNDNTNMYIPAPPSPRPDYYDSELSETDSLTREGSDTEALFGLQEKQKAGKKSSTGGRFGATKTSPPMHRKNKVKESKERHQKKKTPEVTAEVKADSKGRSKKASTPPREVTVTHLSPQQETPPSVRQAAASAKSSPPGKQPSPPQKPISLLKRPSLTKQLSQPKKTPAPKPAPAPKQPAARVSSKTSAAPQQPSSQTTSVSSQPPAARKSSITSIKQAVRRTSSPKQPPSPSQPPDEPVLPTPPPSPPSPPAQRAPSPPSETPTSSPEAAVSPSSPAEESPAPASKPAMTPLQAMIEDFHRNLPPPPAFDDADALNVSMDEPPSLAEEVEMEPDDSYYSDDSLDYQDGRSKGAAKRRRRKKSDWSTTTSFDFVHRKEARKRIPEKLTNRDEGISSLESHNSASDDNDGSRRRRQARLIAAAEETPTDSKPARQDSGKQRSKFDSIRKLLKEGRLEGLETPPPDFVPPPPPAVAKSARRPPGRPAGDAPEAPPERETPVKLRPRDGSAGSGESSQRPRSHSQPASSLVEAAAGRDRSAPSPHEVRSSQSFLSQKGPSSLFVDYRRPSGAGVPTSGTTSSGGGPPRRRPAPRPDPALRLRAESPLRRNRPVRPTEGVQINPLTHARPGGPPLSPLAGGGAFHSAESLHSSLPPVLRASGGKGGGRGHLTLPGERGLERRDVRRADSLAVSKKEKDGDSKFKFSIFKGFWRRKQYSLEQV